jgi:hypothetical protein
MAPIEPGAHIIAQLRTIRWQKPGVGMKAIAPLIVVSRCRNRCAGQVFGRPERGPCARRVQNCEGPIAKLRRPLSETWLIQNGRITPCKKLRTSFRLGTGRRKDDR